MKDSHLGSYSYSWPHMPYKNHQYILCPQNSLWRVCPQLAYLYHNIWIFQIKYTNSFFPPTNHLSSISKYDEGWVTVPVVIYNLSSKTTFLTILYPQPVNLRTNNLFLVTYFETSSWLTFGI